MKLPGCFEGFAVVAGDGKRIKDAAKRLKPARGYSGKLIGANALVALELRSGLAVAMSDSLDGCSPRTVLLQFAYCLLLYNLVQLVKAYVAENGKVLAAAVSTFYLFQDIRRELTAWAYHTDGSWPRCRR